MNVLSVFDGLGGARIALNNLNIDVEHYFSSEIDKKCIDVLKDNFPDSICLGDIKTIKKDELPKIDLLIGGSPCQDLSISGSRLGLEGSQSKLFYEYLKLLRELNPRFFLLENVASMSNEVAEVISDLVRVRHVAINSKIFSPQNRRRYYWTNIPHEIDSITNSDCVRDIIDSDSVNQDKECFNKPKQLIRINYGGQGDRIYSIYAKGICLSASSGGAGSRTGMYLIDPDGKTTEEIIDEIKMPNTTSKELKSNNFVYRNLKARKLTPVEAERMQGIPDGYTKIASKTSREKMIGNGFTVQVIEFLLKGMI